LYFPIAVRSFSSGRTPASEFFVAFTITITRIVVSPSVWPVQPGLHYQFE
jgi:hypothetical protein